MANYIDPGTIALIEKLKGFWLQKGIKVRPGLSLQQIESFESRYMFDLPPDLRLYFATVDGMQEGETDPDMFSFLPLKGVKSIPEELAHFGGIPDYTEIMRSLADPHR
jgi:cell wall assembly regulator SMI1